MAGFDPFGALAGLVGGGLGFILGGPLGAAAGSGLATTAYTGDLGKGILSGLMSYGLGTAGNLLETAGSEALSTALPSTALSGAGEAVPAGMGAGLEGAVGGEMGSFVPPGSLIGGEGGRGGVEALIEANRKLSPWELGQRFDRIGAGLQSPEALKNTFFNHGLSTTVPIGLGAYGMMGGSDQPQMQQAQMQQQRTPVVPTYGTGRQAKMPGPDYDYGPGREFNYFADGGEVDNESLRRKIQIKNSRRIGIGQASREAREYDKRKQNEGRGSLSSPDPFFPMRAPEIRYARGGYISGPGGGIADAVPALVDGQHPAQLSSGEYVVPAHAVSALGDGSSEEGTRQLDKFVDKVMQHKFGTKNRQPKPMKKMKRYPSKFADGGLALA